MNFLEIGTALLEGLGLILSPCILPVLPLVLASSIDGGRERPFGIITGFVLAFSAFVLLSRKLVMLFNLDLDIIKNASLVLLGLLGLVLLSSKLSARFNALTQGAANWGGQLTQHSRGGFLGGLGIGALIGLVWTPCAGPFLAAILVQVIRQANDASAVIQVVAFAFGAGLPMLIIALTGRKIMGRLGFFTRHAESIRKGFGIIILLVVVLIAAGFDKKLAAIGGAPMDTTGVVNQNGLTHALAQPYPAPEFAGIDSWLNSDPLTMASLKGKVVLVDFWTYSCINCVRTLPYITAWDAKYKDQGLVIIGVHAPEFEFEKKRANVEAAIQQHGIHYPVALDNKLDSWTAFNNQYWPAHYLIDRNGQVVYTHFGEGDYAITENNIRHLLGLQPAAPVSAEAGPVKLPFEKQTPETYLGYARAAHFASPQAIVMNNSSNYTIPTALPFHHWALQGKWHIAAEKITANEKNAKLQMHFNARKVFLVMGTASSQPLTAHIKLNGKPLGPQAGKDAPNGTVTISGHNLYELVDQSQAQESLIEITADAPGMELYAFTFGS